MDAQLQKRPTRHILTLPIDVRDQILGYLLPTDEIINFQCPYGYPGLNHIASHGNPQCGQGPGWSCLRERKERRLDIMRTSSILYEDSTRLLYNRVFQLEIGDSGLFFVNLNSMNADSFGRYPFGKMKCLSIKIEASLQSDALRKTVVSLQWVCKTLARANRIRDLRIVLCFKEIWALTDLKVGDVDMLLEPFRLLFNIGNAGVCLRVSTHEFTEELNVKPRSLCPDPSQTPRSPEAEEDHRNQSNMMILVDGLVDDFSNLLLNGEERTMRLEEDEKRIGCTSYQFD